MQNFRSRRAKALRTIAIRLRRTVAYRGSDTNYQLSIVYRSPFAPLFLSPSLPLPAKTPPPLLPLYAHRIRDKTALRRNLAAIGAVSSVPLSLSRSQKNKLYLSRPPVVSSSSSLAFLATVAAVYCFFSPKNIVRQTRGSRTESRDDTHRMSDVECVNACMRTRAGAAAAAAAAIRRAATDEKSRSFVVCRRGGQRW